MQKRSRFQEKVKFVEAAGGRVSDGNALDAVEDIRDGSIEMGGPESKLIGILVAKADNIAVLEPTTSDLPSVDENAMPLATILYVVPTALQNNGGALPGNARVGELEVLSGCAAASDQKGRFGDPNEVA